MNMKLMKIIQDAVTKYQPNRTPVGDYEQYVRQLDSDSTINKTMKGWSAMCSRVSETWRIHTGALKQFLRLVVDQHLTQTLQLVLPSICHPSVFTIKSQTIVEDLTYTADL